LCRVAYQEVGATSRPVPQAQGVTMESWRIVWRNGFVPVMSTASLEALKSGLESNDVRLIQGATTIPPPLHCVSDWPTESADFLGFGYWQGERAGEASVGDVECRFAKLCFEADQRLGEPAACRWALNWWDDCPRDEVFRDLLAEVNLALAERQAVAA
jgi:hypothetical protein